MHIESTGGEGEKKIPKKNFHCEIVSHYHPERGFRYV
jgi:hypothetical protein